MSRASEIRRVRDLVVAVRGGRSRALVIHGPPGIGKSWLCRRAATLAKGFTVVATRGVDSETDLGYCGLFDLLGPLLGPHLDRLPAARAGRLRGALRLDEVRAVDQFAVAVATMDLLAIAAEDAPVLVVVDDAPLVDSPSLEALQFAARRLDADRVGFLLAARDELAAPFINAGFESLAVGGSSGGEAARELSPDQRIGAAPLTDRAAWRRARGHDHALRLRLERARDLAQAGRAGEALLELDTILDRDGGTELGGAS